MLRHIKKLVETQRQIFTRDRRITHTISFEGVVVTSEHALDAGLLRQVLEKLGIEAKIVRYELISQYKDGELIGEYVWDKKVI